MTPSTKIFLVKLKWFLYERFSSAWDLVALLFNFPVSGNTLLKRNGKQVIVYLGEHLPPRIPRIAKWVKRSSEYSVVLVCSRQGFYEKFSDPNFDAVFLFRNAFHLERIVKQIPNIRLIHAFAPKSFYPDLIRKKFKHKFIIDYQDVFGNYYGLNPLLRWLKKELPHEKACLEHADGIVGQSLEPNAAMRKYGIKNKPKTIFFPLYCDDDVFQNNTKQLNTDDIHLVYAGGVVGSHRNPKQYGNIQFHDIIKILSEQKIHFHIYPSPSNNRADYEEYKEIARKNPFFHFHKSVSQQDLARELSQYHFGFHTGFVHEEEHKQSFDKYKYCTTLKLFNFIEAGIPVIISNNLIYQSWILERNNSGITITKQELFELKKKIIEMNYQKLSQNVVNAQKKLSLRKNCQRLLDFYNKL